MNSAPRPSSRCTAPTAAGSIILHQAGVPAGGRGRAAPRRLRCIAPVVGIPALAALVFIAVLACVDACVRRRRARPARADFASRRVAAMHVLQPLVRCWGRRQRRPRAGDESAPRLALDPNVAFRDGRILVVPIPGPARSSSPPLPRTFVARGCAAIASTGWEAYDARVIGSTIVGGELATSAYPEGYVQVRIRRRPRAWGATVVIAGLAFTSAIDPLAVFVFGSAAAAEITRGWWRTGSGRAPRGAGGDTVKREYWKYMVIIFPYLKRHKALASASLALMGCGALAALAQPWPLAFVVDSVLGTTRRRTPSPTSWGAHPTT